MTHVACLAAMGFAVYVIAAGEATSSTYGCLLASVLVYWLVPVRRPQPRPPRRPRRRLR